ncbi:glycerol-3-phosphate 1-O-acyltransferase PlsY [Actibacterium lipolyticum]|uniref:Glycerol-3-phosphate acyltransferase n=1 Tax=Actibacterium lipolyticum TaxID=1524263 RepID=A0A238KSK2_9RHOB|nr:glycerol-3-phosphate 1-O-acyltransferase PlsY [Actibacterium lipolyticum]SMX45813.1 putative glycerol-3-phosphate acyltransferase [Actibacterium lipolyticum]
MPEIITSAPMLGLVALVAYLVGAVPFGVVIARIFGLGDLRAIGSGNIGATNVLRTGNKLAAFLTLILDAGKGGFAVLVARAFFAEDAAQLAGLAAFVGHIFPVYLGFKGGKGVATFLGTLLALAWPVGLAACAMWLLSAVISRYSSLSALMAAATCPLSMIYFGEGRLIFLGIIFTILIYFRHTPNIKRLKAGTEPKIGKK